MSEMIELSKIRRDGETQSRAFGTTGTTVYDYADAMREGADFPAITVFYDGENYWLADGFHRVAAAQELKHRFIKADVRQGTLDDAVLHSLGPANRENGLQLTREDKRRRVMAMLKHPEWSQWSDREIGKHCGVDHKTVGSWRGLAGGEIPQVNERKGADGKIYTVKHWGLSNGMAFWQQVAKFRLDKEMVIDQIQGGATVLTDLNMSKEDCWQRLDQIARDRTGELFPIGSIVQHSTGRFGKVLLVQPYSLRVMDFRTNNENTWHLDDCKPSTQEAYEASLPPATTPESDESDKSEIYNGFPAYPTKPVSIGPETFYKGDLVKTPTGHDGTVTGATGRLVTVQTVNGERDYNRAFLTLVRRAEAAEETSTDGESPDLADRDYEEIIVPAFTRIFEYVEDGVRTIQLLEDIPNIIEWLSQVQETIESELNAIETVDS